MSHSHSDFNVCLVKRGDILTDIIRAIRDTGGILLRRWFLRRPPLHRSRTVFLPPTLRLIQILKINHELRRKRHGHFGAHHRDQFGPFDKKRVQGRYTAVIS